MTEREISVATEESHTIAVLVDNEAGVLARVIGLFSGRGYNIDSLTVAEVDVDESISRITLVTTGTPKVSGIGDKRVESLRIAEIFRARVVDATTESFVFEMTGKTAKLNAFIELMTPLGLVDVSRTGVVAIARGAESL
jgi:acetolactate synthase-1/3 small subunit